MTLYPQQHSITRMHDGRLLGLTEDGTWWLWDYDPRAPELVKLPAHREGKWLTIGTTHELFAMSDGRVLDWTPVDGRWRLWDYRPDEPDILTGPNAEGRWSTIGSGHDLIPLPDGTVLDWKRTDNTWRLWQYDAGDPDPDPGRLHPRPRVPGQPWDILVGPVDQGSWLVTHPVRKNRVSAGNRLTSMADGTVIEWASDGRWRTWARQDLLRPAGDAAIGGVEPSPLGQGQWGAIGEGHHLIPTLDGQMIDWMHVTGDFRLWNYDEARRELVGPPRRSGVWRTLNEMPDRLQFRLRYMVERASTDDFLQGGSDEVYVQAVGLDSAMVTAGPDGQPVAATITSPVIGDISDDAVRGPWRTDPQVLIEFDVHRPVDWPRTFTVTLMIVEMDDENLETIFRSLVLDVGDEIETAATAAAVSAVGAGFGSVLPGIGTAVGAAVGALVGAGYATIVDAIQSGLGNDVFSPISRTITVDDPNRIWTHPDVGLSQVIHVEEHDASYDIEYDWHWA